MIVVHEDGTRLDWPKRLDAQVIADLDRWRRYLELSLNIPNGQLRAIRWSDGELQLVLRRTPEPEIWNPKSAHGGLRPVTGLSGPRSAAYAMRVQ
jgi:hypothetical protein